MITSSERGVLKNKYFKTMSSIVEQRLISFEESWNTALRLPVAETQSACESFRKAAEAFLKIQILLCYGDDKGLRIIEGEEDILGNINGNPQKLMFEGLMKVYKNVTSFKQNISQSLYEINNSSKESHHDNDLSKYEQDVLYNNALLHTTKIGKALYKQLGKQAPTTFYHATEYGRQFSKILSTDDWKDFYQDVSRFVNKREKYILVAPSNYHGVNEATL